MPEYGTMREMLGDAEVDRMRDAHEAKRAAAQKRQEAEARENLKRALRPLYTKLKEQAAMKDRQATEELERMFGGNHE
jgi:hypothetical protein